MDEDEDEAELNALEDSAELPPELLLLLSTIELLMVSESGSVITELADLIRDELDDWRKPTDTSLGDEEAEREHFVAVVVDRRITPPPDEDAEEDEEVSSSVDEADEPLASLPVDWKWKCL